MRSDETKAEAVRQQAQDIASAEVHFLPPVPGSCPICGAKHERGTPHDPNSAYYRMRYRRKYGHWPGESDGECAPKERPEN